MNKFIALNGRSLSGKDTIANYLSDKYGFIKISFAEPLYKIAHDYFGMTYKDRSLLQAIGQGYRSIDEDVWVKYLFKKLEEKVNSNEISKDSNIVITDIRQENEYVASVMNGFVPIKVSAPLEKRVERATMRDGKIPDIKLWEATAETGADNFPYIEIINDSSLDDLYKKVDSIVANHTLGHSLLHAAMSKIMEDLKGTIKLNSNRNIK